MQSAAKEAGYPMKFSEVKPTLNKCTTLLLNAAMRTGISVLDIYGSEVKGTMIKWSMDKGGNMSLEMLDETQTKRFKATSKKEPGIVVSDQWSEWLQGVYQGTGVDE